MLNIPVSGGDGCAIVDDDFADRFAKHGWCLSNGYPSTRIKGRLHLMHHLVIGKKDGMVVDHINHNKLDNRRENLRFITNQQNVTRSAGLSKNNTSGYVGVYRHRKGWAAQIMVDRKTIHLGTFRCPVEAAIFRDVAAMELHGEFATLNFPEHVKGVLY